MDNVYTRQTELIDRSGLGLLPGIALAVLIALCLIAAILLETWWAVAIAFAGAIGSGVVVTYIVLKTVLAGDDDDSR
jgi:putative flippase GtrA